MSKGNSKTTQAKQDAQTGPVVWCGPTIPGVAKQYDTFTGGTPRAMEAAIKDHPALAGLLVPLDAFPEARRALEAGEGRMTALARMARAHFTKGG